MRNNIHFCFTLVLITVTCSLFSQTSVQISQPDLELRDNRVFISYEILGSSSADLFEIWIEVSDNNGNPLNVRSLSGDFGENIRGGGRKQITWDYEKDAGSLDEGIYVQVFGELLNTKPEEVISPATEPSTKNEKLETKGAINKSGAILRSIAIPGWGLSAMNPGKPHWLKGVVGYGALTSAIILNRMAYENYSKYLDSSEPIEFHEYYDNAVSQQNLSRISAWVAAGIWLTDVFWTMLSDPGNSNRVSLGSGYDPSIQAAMVAFRYNF